MIAPIISEGKNLWELNEQCRKNPDSAGWMGLYAAPFIWADRETKMTRAYNELQRRLDASEYK